MNQWYWDWFLCVCESLLYMEWRFISHISKTKSTGPFFYLCLRTCLETKTVLRQVLDRWRCRFSVSVLDRRSFSKFKFNFFITHQQAAPIKYWIFFWKLPWLNEILHFMKCILILWNYCSIIEHTIFFWLFVTHASIFYFQILRRVTCGTKVTPVQLSQNVLRQLQVMGCADLAAV